MLRNIIILFVCIVCIGCSENSTTSESNMISSPEFSQLEEDAYELLYNSAQFASAAVGIAGTPPGQVEAFQVLLASDNADLLFKKLQSEAKIEGQLYGLCGLYLVNKPYFDSTLPMYKESESEVSTFVGCILSTQTVKEIIPAIEDGGWPTSYRDCQI